MAEDPQRIAADRALINDAKARGPGAKLAVYTRLSGPGWLQSAITLGGGSLAGSLYLGVLGGYNFLWLQLLAMLMGVVMLSAIGYVALSTGERPFPLINKKINPVLGWGWAIATLLANMVWCLPQYSLGTAAVQQNLLPSVVGPNSAMGDFNGKLVIVLVFLAVTIFITWIYDSKGWGVRVYEWTLKIMVAGIVLCFFGVAVQLSFSDSGLDWGAVFQGFVPDLSLLTKPAAAFEPFLAAVAPENRAFWENLIVSDQRDVMVTAAATAVGINMTFLLPYSMLAKGWDKDFRGLAIFDLSTGLLIPFVLATGCVVIAAANQFHAKPAPGFISTVDAAGNPVTPAPNLVADFNRLTADRVKHEAGTVAPNLTDAEIKARAAALPEADRMLAAMLVKRDAFNLSSALAPLTGSVVANVIFGIGVLGMALSTITILMLISGFVICEMLGLPRGGWSHRIGCLAACVGAIGPFAWKQAAFWLAVPTSIFGMVLLPIAYITFFLLMNSRGAMGDNRPRGAKRLLWNTLMGIAILLAGFGSVWSVWSKTGWYGAAAVAVFLGLVAAAHFLRKRSKPDQRGFEVVQPAEVV